MRRKDGGLVEAESEKANTIWIGEAMRRQVKFSAKSIRVVGRGVLCWGAVGKGAVAWNARNQQSVSESCRVSAVHCIGSELISKKDEY